MHVNGYAKDRWGQLGLKWYSELESEWWLLIGIIINTFIKIWGFDQHIGADPIGWIRQGNWSDRHWKEDKTT